jgi:flagellin-like protein
MLTKKGLSSVIGVVLIILLTVSAAVILAGFVIPWVRGLLNTSTECVEYNDYFGFVESFEVSGVEKNYNCFDSSGLHGFSVKAKSVDSEKEENIQGFAVSFIGGSSSERADVLEGEPENCLDKGVKKITSSCGKDIEMVPSGEIRTYVYNASGRSFEKMEIYPILESGRVCEISDSIRLEFCKTVDLNTG